MIYRAMPDFYHRRRAKLTACESQSMDDYYSEHDEVI
jgi:hypothetical protein